MPYRDFSSTEAESDGGETFSALRVSAADHGKYSGCDSYESEKR